MKNLIPTNKIEITPTSYPTGFLVAKYDDEGFTSGNRWFSEYKQAQAYSVTL